jgi:hypothetical protein
MSPHRYLISIKKKSRCRAVLFEASNSLPQLLARLISSISCLGLTTDEADALATTMARMYARTDNFQQTRPFFKTIHKLDEAIVAVLHPDIRVNDAIGVLVVNNEEFRALIN